MKTDLTDGSMVGPWFYGPDGRGRYMAVIGCGQCGRHFVGSWMPKGKTKTVHPRMRSLKVAKEWLASHHCGVADVQS